LTFEIRSKKDGGYPDNNTSQSDDVKKDNLCFDLHSIKQEEQHPDRKKTV